ncbi:MAG TPA: hypothetical protein VG406_08280 [Isosphaeraceae bacterium]|jgi:hypothetical protein|nr:hypothetical protein [Isosphaeraceae bacterium]
MSPATAPGWWRGLLVAAAICPAVGCQAEHVSMSRPDGKIMHDDVRYYPPQPETPATNRLKARLKAQQVARMKAMGFDVTEPAPGAGDRTSTINPPETGAPR